MFNDKTPKLSGKLNKELATVSAMLKIYCITHHKSDNTPCSICKQLEQYARMRLDRCPYGEDKPTCNQCPIHCYKPEPKQMMQQVMRYSGPRMLLSHPILALRHLVHERRAIPKKPLAGQSNYHQRKTKKGQ